MAAAVMVPNFNVYGHMDHRHPYKDKARLLNEDISHPRWLDPPPAVRSRAELQQARKAARVPDPRTYDFDGDGHVSQMDNLVGRCFDKDKDGRLTPNERRQAVKAYEGGFLDRFARGYDSQGERGRGTMLQQKKGVIIDAANPDAAKDAYPPHPISKKIPRHNTRTSLLLDRAAELKNAALAMGDKWAQTQVPVREPQPPTAETQPRTCSLGRVRERAEADSQASRVHAGLLPMSMPCNPDREMRTVGMEYVEQPFIATRSQLNETRKELLKRDAEAQRAKGDEVFPDKDVLKSEKEALEFEFRRPPPAAEPMTLTKLKDERRVAKIEYDMANFHVEPQVIPREYPRYSDKPDVPFWTVGANNGSGSGSSRSGPSKTAVPRMTSEPVLKVTEVQWKDFEDHDKSIQEPDAAAGLGPRGLSQDRPEACLGTNTVLRWTSDQIKHGKGLNQPRLFDSIRTPHIGPRDLESLDLTSAMEPIRTAALKRQAETRKQNAKRPPQNMLRTAEANLDMSIDAPSSVWPEKSQQLRSIMARRALVRSTAEGPPAQGATTDVTNLAPTRPVGLLLSTQRPRSEQSGIRSGGFQNVQDALVTMASEKGSTRRNAAASSSALRTSSAPAAPALEL